MPIKKENKEKDFGARVTVELRGEAKLKFFEEVEKTGIAEAKLARKIICEYYSVTHMRF